jgi:DNA-binding response OmpR family regulator
MKILIIDDDIKMCSFIKMGLSEIDFFLDMAHDTITGEKLLLTKKYDVILLDVMLPGVNGFEFCKKIRGYNITTPVLMLTSLDSTEDIVEGFGCGADDYLEKPFSIHVLIARIKALDRRNKNNIIKPVMAIANLELNTLTKKLQRDNKTILLTAIEYKLLELFLANQGKVLDRTEIGERVWGHSFNTGSNFIDVHINSLRNKIDKDFTPKLIHTVVGFGYVMKDSE